MEYSADWILPVAITAAVECAAVAAVVSAAGSPAAMGHWLGYAAAVSAAAVRAAVPVAVQMAVYSAELCWDCSDRWLLIAKGAEPASVGLTSTPELSGSRGLPISVAL